MISIDRAKARRERAQAMAKQDIIDAALRCFAKNGYPNTKMSDIAAEAGYTAASLYTYFPGKLEIFTAATETFLSEVSASFGDVPECECETFDALVDEVTARVRTLCAFGDLKHDVLAFYMRLRWSSEPVLAEIKARLGPECTECMDDARSSEKELERRSIALWRALGVERFGIRPDIIAGVMGGIVETFFSRRYLLGLGGTLSEDADDIAELLLFGLRGRSPTSASLAADTRHTAKI